MTGVAEVEPVESFRSRARRWLKENMPPAPEKIPLWADDKLWTRARGLQRTRQVKQGR